MSIIIFAIILSFLVIIHELGHFIAAKWAKIKVDEFGLGYPPRAKRLFTKFGTIFTLNWIPFGGFVRMRGEEVEPKGNTPKKGDFLYVSPAKRMVVVLAGVVVNFLFGILAFAIVFSIIGVPEPIDTARIGVVVADSPADQAGVPANVEILAIQTEQGKQEVASPDEVVQIVAANRGSEVVLITSGQCEGRSCQESVAEYPVYIRTKQETPEGEGAMGVIFEPVAYVKYDGLERPMRGIMFGLEQALGLSLLILTALGDMITNLVSRGELAKELAGPVGIVYQAQQSGLFNQGVLTILSFAGMLSVNLAIVNLLPILPLDGGKAVFTLVETAVGRARTKKLEFYLNYAGYSFLIMLILLITARDVWRIVQPLIPALG